MNASKFLIPSVVTVAFASIIGIAYAQTGTANSPSKDNVGNPPDIKNNANTGGAADNRSTDKMNRDSTGTMNRDSTGNMNRDSKSDMDRGAARGTNRDSTGAMNRDSTGTMSRDSNGNMNRSSTGDRSTERVARADRN